MKSLFPLDFDGSCGNMVTRRRDSGATCQLWVFLKGANWEDAKNRSLPERPCVGLKLAEPKLLGAVSFGSWVANRTAEHDFFLLVGVP